MPSPTARQSRKRRVSPYQVSPRCCSLPFKGHRQQGLPRAAHRLRDFAARGRYSSSSDEEQEHVVFSRPRCPIDSPTHVSLPVQLQHASPRPPLHVHCPAYSQKLGRAVVLTAPLINAHFEDDDLEIITSPASLPLGLWGPPSPPASTVAESTYTFKPRRTPSISPNDAVAPHSTRLKPCLTLLPHLSSTPATLDVDALALCFASSTVVSR